MVTKIEFDSRVLSVKLGTHSLSQKPREIISLGENSKNIRCAKLFTLMHMQKIFSKFSVQHFEK